MRASCVEFVLAGLYATDRISPVAAPRKDRVRNQRSRVAGLEATADNMPGPRLGGIIHTYQRYDPEKLPSPTQPPPDLVSPAFEHLLIYGSMRELTEEELARAVRLDPSQIAGLGPSLDALIAHARGAEAQDPGEVRDRAASRRRPADEYRDQAEPMKPPRDARERVRERCRDEQLRDLERLWYHAGDERSPFARQICCSSSSGSATSTRSTSWPRSTTSPAARR